MSFPNLAQHGVISIDVETTGTKWQSDEMFGIALSVPGEDFYWDIRKTPKVIDWLYDSLKTYTGKMVNHNIKFDAHFLRQYGVDISEHNLQCTMVRAQLINEHLFRYNLDDLCHMYLGEGKEEPYEELAEMFGGKPTRAVQITNLYKAPFELTSKYAKKDTNLALRLWQWQNVEIKEKSLGRICSLEDSVLPVLLRMEARGIRIDVQKAEENMAELAKKIKTMQKEVDRQVGRAFNINSTPQMREFFVEEKVSDRQFRAIDGTLIGSTAKKDKDGNYNPSLAVGNLKTINHPVARMVTELRTMIKMHGTFLRDQILGYEQNGYIYPNFNQCGTVNGRFSASKPALQAIPKRNREMSALTRSVFLPDEGEEILRCDFEQSDFRGFVHYTASPPLVQAYEKDPWTDFHGLIADLLRIPRSPRSGGGANAKQINLGSIFGMGIGRLAKEMGLPYTEEISKSGKAWLKPGPEAEAVFVLYHKAVPGVARLNKIASSIAQSRGYVKSVCGRRLRFPNKKHSWMAPGYLYSSFTSDLCKSAMVATDGLAKIKLQVHDEIIFSIDDRSVIPEIRHAMETCLGDLTTVPIRTGPQVGPNWFECKEI